MKLGLVFIHFLYIVACNSLFVLAVYNIIVIMFPPPLSAVFLYYQPHIFHSFAVFGAGGDNINSCCVYTAVTENIYETLECNLRHDIDKRYRVDVLKSCEKHCTSN